MKIGKVPNEILQRIVLNKLKHNRKEVILRPGIGEDCCAVDFGENICVMSTDPITGAENEVGRLAVHITCNDIAACGVEPLGILATILAPKDCTEQQLEQIMEQMCSTADKLNVDIIGGHTEITDAVNRFVVITTAIGKAHKAQLVSSNGASPGDAVLITKAVGIEGTAIIAHDKECELEKAFGKEFCITAKGFMNEISVVLDGIEAAKNGATSMHDITEGGVLGAAWELGIASGCGVKLYEGSIPIRTQTEEICNFYSLNPLKLISSGSMIFTATDGNNAVQALKRKGIDASIIGEVTEDTKSVLIKKDGSAVIIEQPDSDELYKIING